MAKLCKVVSLVAAFVWYIWWNYSSVIIVITYVTTAALVIFFKANLHSQGIEQGITQKVAFKPRHSSKIRLSYTKLNEEIHTIQIDPTWIDFRLTRVHFEKVFRLV